MQDEEIALFNACADLVSLKKWEAFPLHLLGSWRAGEWIGVREVCLQISVAVGDLAPDLFAAWLPDPKGHDGYAVILFYEDESKWSMAAHYNRGRPPPGRCGAETIAATSRGRPFRLLPVRRLSRRPRRLSVSMSR